MRLVVSAVVAVCWCGWVSGAPRTWELRDGRWQQVDVPDTRPVEDPALDRVEELLARNQNTAARKLAVSWLKANLDSPIRDRALLLEARALYQYGDRIRAFYYCDELMDTYPESPLFYRALELQYAIADAYLRGYKLRFLMIPLFGAEDDAVEMLFRIQQRAPGSPLAEKALRRTADHYFDDRDYDLAADAYAAYARAYPRSPDLPIVRLRQAFSAWAQFRGILFDPTPLIDARTQLVDVAGAYPDLAAQYNLWPVIERMDKTFADKLFQRADFHQRTGEPKAAAYMYTFLVKTYPSFPEAARAQARLDGLPAWAKEGVQPAVTGGYAPSTLPAAALESEPLRSRIPPRQPASRLAP